MKKWNVLVFPAGTEIGLEIYESLKNCKEVNLVGAGVAASNIGKIKYPKYEITPSIYEKGWDKKTNKGNWGVEDKGQDAEA